MAEDALKMYLDALDTLGYQSDLTYYAATCHYKLEDYDSALTLVEHIIEQGKYNHPEWFMGSGSTHTSNSCISISIQLQESFLIEAFNLKAAIEFQRNNIQQKESIQHAVHAFDEELERYIPVLMAQTKIYWYKENYDTVEKLFRQNVEFCGDHETWKLNVAHIFFMQQGSKFKDAISYYEPIVQKKTENGSILDVAAIVLANLCVSYIMTNQNEKAEEIMKKIESEEESLSHTDTEKQIYHSCIVNLVIGTLYCEKRNFEFGIGRICKSLEPYEKKLRPDTWHYTKRCFLALAENISKHMITLKDEACHEILHFLKEIETYGKDIPAFMLSAG